MAQNVLQNVARSTGEWVHNAQDFCKGLQFSITGTLGHLQHALHLPLKNTQEHKTPLQISDQDTANYANELAAWRHNPTWVDEQPQMKVTNPKGALCQVDSLFKIGIPPLAIYNILCDPENKRVFKDIKEVRYRKVLEDYGNRQVVELEQSAIWRFLWMSGTLSVCVRVDQDRDALSIKYELAKEGFMKRFEGTWAIQPLYVDADGEQLLPIDKAPCRVASLVTLHQVVQPVFIPPPPFSWYLQRISAKTTEKLLEDLQAEGKRIRECSPMEDGLPNDERNVEANRNERAALLNRQWKSRRNSNRRQARDAL